MKKKTHRHSQFALIFMVGRRETGFQMQFSFPLLEEIAMYGQD